MIAGKRLATAQCCQAVAALYPWSSSIQRTLLIPQQFLLACNLMFLKVVFAQQHKIFLLFLKLHSPQSEWVRWIRNCWKSWSARSAKHLWPITKNARSWSAQSADWPTQSATAYRSCWSRKHAGWLTTKLKSDSIVARPAAPSGCGFGWPLGRGYRHLLYPLATFLNWGQEVGINARHGHNEEE